VVIIDPLNPPKSANLTDFEFSKLTIFRDQLSDETRVSSEKHEMKPLQDSADGMKRAQT
jgi:hypothetical protein